MSLYSVVSRYIVASYSIFSCLESEVYLIGFSVYQLRKENSDISASSFTFVKYKVKFLARKALHLEKWFLCRLADIYQPFWGTCSVYLYERRGCKIHTLALKIKEGDFYEIFSYLSAYPVSRTPQTSRLLIHTAVRTSGIVRSMLVVFKFPHK